MSNNSSGRYLRRAQAFQAYESSINTRYSKNIRHRFGNNWITVFLCKLVGVYSYAHRKASNASERKHTYHEEDVQRESVISSRVTARWTFILAIFAFMQFLILRSQLGEMHSGGDDTHTLAGAAKSQADYAKNATATARDAFIAENRAIIGPNEASIAPIQIGKGFVATIQYKNTGRQAAGLNVIMQAKIYNTVDEWGSSPVL